MNNGSAWQHGMKAIERLGSLRPTGPAWVEKDHGGGNHESHEEAVQGFGAKMI